MTIEMFTQFLGWCAVINIGLLAWWSLFILFAHDWVYKLHNQWFRLSVEEFDLTHYRGIALFKIVVFFFNLVPYFALRIIA